MTHVRIATRRAALAASAMIGLVALASGCTTAEDPAPAAPPAMAPLPAEESPAVLREQFEAGER
jgi:hypothetical protein